MKNRRKVKTQWHKSKFISQAAASADQEERETRETLPEESFYTAYGHDRVFFEQHHTLDREREDLERRRDKEERMRQKRIPNRHFCTKQTTKCFEHLTRFHFA